MTTLTISMVQKTPGRTIRSDAYRFWRVTMKILIVGLLGTLSAFGQFGLTQWNADAGLPQNSVRGIVQTPDGYI